MTDIIFKLRFLWPHIMNGYELWKSSIWDKDLDSNLCCDGKECGCGGESIRDVLNFSNKDT